MLRDGVQPDIAARRSAGMSISEVTAYYDQDPEFARLWDMAVPNEVSEDFTASSRLLTPPALEALLWAQATDDEVAGYFSMTKDEFMARVKGDSKLQRVYDTARLGGRAAMRKAQFKSVVDGNVSAQQFLGKQYLGQADKVEVESTVRHEMSLEDVARRIALIANKTNIAVMPVIEPIDAEVVTSE